MAAEALLFSANSMPKNSLSGDFCANIENDCEIIDCNSIFFCNFTPHNGMF